MRERTTTRARLPQFAGSLDDVICKVVLLVWPLLYIHFFFGIESDYAAGLGEILCGCFHLFLFAMDDVHIGRTLCLWTYNI